MRYALLLAFAVGCNSRDASTPRRDSEESKPATVATVPASKPIKTTEPEPRYNGIPLSSWAEWIGDANQDLSEKSGDALGAIGVKAIPALLIACKNNRHHVRGSAASGLMTISAQTKNLPEEAVAALIDLAEKDKTPYVRVRAIYALSWCKIRKPELLPVFEKLSRDSDPTVANTASEAIKRISD